MNYGKMAQEIFTEALEHFETLRLNDNISNIERTKLCILCQKFKEYFSRWISCQEAEAKAYEAYTRSTSLWEMLEISQDKWHQWIMSNT